MALSHLESELTFNFPPHAEDKHILKTLERFVFEAASEKAIYFGIKDFYLEKNLRIRAEFDPENGNPIKTILCKKGEHNGRGREESETIIEDTLVKFFEGNSQLTVVKHRFVFTFKNHPKWKNVGVVIDHVESPIKMKRVEIEAIDDPDIIDEIQKIPFLKSWKRETRPSWVYFKRKIGIAGPPSSGKTTVARAFVNFLSVTYGATVEYVNEYARTHIARYGVPHWYVQPLIMWSQDRRENDSSTYPMFVTDSPKFLAYIYALFNRTGNLDDEAIYILSKLYKASLYAAKDYSDLILLTPKSVKAEGIRYQDDNDAEALYSMMKGFLFNHDINFIECDYNHALEELAYEIFNLNKVEDE
ncbi:MAG: ATP-binding protein [Candidatus Peribacteraceae bacterium]|nr:ATP-binding protein [Candidatus Peribacteraceae bacterium]